MFIVWGKKRVERNQGLVADFCPICREVRAFQLIRVGLASHVYYVSFGEGKLAGHIIRCNECRVKLAVDPTRYATTEKDARVGLEVLLGGTFPKLREVYAIHWLRIWINCSSCPRLCSLEITNRK